MTALTIQQRDLIAAAFQSAVEEVVVEHYPAVTQEHQLTSRIAQRIEDRLNNLNLAGVTLRVSTQELPDKGRGAAESRLGADLWITLTLQNEFSKGFLVQSKWQGDRDFGRYVDQCERMLNVSKSSYGWEFGRNGVRVYGAKRVIARSAYHDRYTLDFGRKIQTVLKKMLDCREGDYALGIPSGVNPRDHMSSMIQDWNAQAAVSLEIIQSDPRD